MSIDDLIKTFEKSTESARTQGKASSVKAAMSNIRAQSEIIYDKTNYSYGKNPFTLGSCKQTPNTLFADKDVVIFINSATDNNMSLATCVSKGVVGKVTSFAVSAPLPGQDGFSWCVDNTGNSKQIVGSLKGDVCR
jgi:hypothetical protein